MQQRQPVGQPLRIVPHARRQVIGVRDDLLDHAVLNTEIAHLHLDKARIRRMRGAAALQHHAFTGA